MIFEGQAGRLRNTYYMAWTLFRPALSDGDRGQHLLIRVLTPCWHSDDEEPSQRYEYALTPAAIVPAHCLGLLDATQRLAICGTADLHRQRHHAVDVLPGHAYRIGTLCRPYFAGHWRYVASRIGESSNGRTADSDSVNLGSNPSSPANPLRDCFQSNPTVRPETHPHGGFHAPGDARAFQVEPTNPV